MKKTLKDAAVNTIIAKTDLSFYSIVYSLIFRSEYRDMCNQIYSDIEEVVSYSVLNNLQKLFNKI